MDAIAAANNPTRVDFAFAQRTISAISSAVSSAARAVFQAFIYPFWALYSYLFPERKSITLNEVPYPALSPQTVRPLPPAASLTDVALAASEVGPMLHWSDLHMTPQSDPRPPVLSPIEMAATQRERVDHEGLRLVLSPVAFPLRVSDLKGDTAEEITDRTSTCGAVVVFVNVTRKTPSLVVTPIKGIRRFPIMAATSPPQNRPSFAMIAVLLYGMNAFFMKKLTLTLPVSPRQPLLTRSIVLAQGPSSDNRSAIVPSKKGKLGYTLKHFLKVIAQS